MLLRSRDGRCSIFTSPTFREESRVLSFILIERPWQNHLHQQVQTLLEDELSDSSEARQELGTQIRLCHTSDAGATWLPSGVRDILVKDREMMRKSGRFLTNSPWFLHWNSDPCCALCIQLVFLLSSCTCSCHCAEKSVNVFASHAAPTVWAQVVEFWPIQSYPDDLPCLQALQTICSDAADREHPISLWSTFLITTPWSTWIWPKHFRNRFLRCHGGPRLHTRWAMENLCYAVCDGSFGKFERTLIAEHTYWIAIKQIGKYAVYHWDPMSQSCHKFPKNI